MNRPFAILKDLLPQRDNTRREKPEGAPDRTDGKPVRPAEARSRGPRRPEGADASQPRKPRAPRSSDNAAAVSIEAGSDIAPPQQPRRNAGRPSQPRGEGRPNAARTEGQGGQRRRPAHPRPAVETPPVDPAVLAAEAEKAAKAAERAKQQRELAEEGMRALTAQHPTLFDRQNPVPLAIGIHKPLLEAAREGTLPATVAAVRAAIGRWTSSKHYLAILTAGAARLDLTGQPQGEVTAEQAEAAVTWLEKRLAQQKARSHQGRKRGPRPQAKTAAPAETSVAVEAASPAAIEPATASPNPDESTPS